MERNKESYYTSLYELAAALNSARSSESILRSITEGVAEAMGARGCSLMLLTPDKKILLHTVAYGLSDWYVRKGPVSRQYFFPARQLFHCVAQVEHPNSHRRGIESARHSEQNTQ